MAVDLQKQKEPVSYLEKRFGGNRQPLKVKELFLSSPYQPALIAEIKHKSPSKGILVHNFDPLKLANIYQSNGAAAISILTDEEFFGGSLDDLRIVRNNFANIPILRKDFIIDEYQVYQSYFYGADLVLLIVKALQTKEFNKLVNLILSLGMTPLVEVHSKEELEIALEYHPMMIGINNRNLEDFTVDLQTTIDLRKEISDHVLVVSESGISNASHVQLLKEHNVHAILVGEAILTAPNVRQKIKELLSVK